jgi:hypothetical protein
MRLYRRTTHDVNGDFKRHMEDRWAKIPTQFRSLIHLLDPHEFYTLNEFLSEVYGYAKEYPECNDIEVVGTPEKAETALEQLALEDIIEAIGIDELCKNNVEYFTAEGIAAIPTSRLIGLTNSGWYFFDEARLPIGPYESRALAAESFSRYSAYLASGQPCPGKAQLKW